MFQKSGIYMLEDPEHAGRRTSDVFSYTRNGNHFVAVCDTDCDATYLLDSDENILVAVDKHGKVYVDGSHVGSWSIGASNKWVLRDLNSVTIFESSTDKALVSAEHEYNKKFLSERF